TSPIPTTWRDSRELRRRSDEARPGRLRGLQEPGRVDGACRRTSLESPQTSPTQYLCGGDEGSTARGLIGVGAGGPGPLSPSPFQSFSAVLGKTGAKVVAPKQPATLDHPRLPTGFGHLSCPLHRFIEGVEASLPLEVKADPEGGHFVAQYPAGRSARCTWKSRGGQLQRARFGGTTALHRSVNMRAARAGGPLAPTWMPIESVAR